MGKPRFLPAALFVRSRDFGRVSSPVYAEDSGLNPGERAWAMFQHNTAFAVLKGLKKNELHISELAKELGVGGGWLTRKLHGRAPADLGEMFEWTRHLELLAKSRSRSLHR